MPFVLTALVFSTLVAPSSPSTRDVGRAAQAKPEHCAEYPDGVPIEAYYLHDYLRDHNFTPPQGWVGGRVYRAEDPYLSRRAKDHSNAGKLREYDVYPKVKGQPRRAERIVVVESKLIRTAWFTPDHYSTFIDMYDLMCLDPFGLLSGPFE